tara:strand:- start:355 stop:765 length:411 start_codon:yes stop_codon:yes gene_type:complete
MCSEQHEAKRALALTFLDHSFSGRVEEVIAMLHDDFHWWVLGNPDRLRISGMLEPQAARRMIRNMHKVLPDGMRHEIIGTTVEGDRVAVEAVAEGHWVDGRAYHNTYHFLVTICDGKITSLREYMDTLEVDRLSNN